MNETLTVILLILLVPGSLLSRTRDAMRFAHTASRAAKQSHQQAVWQRAFYPEARASEVQHEQFRSSAWQYWAMSIGAGAATVVRDDPFLGASHTWVPDNTVSLERSWYLTDQFTGIVDISLVAPTLRLGYVITEQSRVSLGVGAWFTRFGAIDHLRFSSLKKCVCVVVGLQLKTWKMGHIKRVFRLLLQLHLIIFFQKTASCASYSLMISFMLCVMSKNYPALASSNLFTYL